MVSNHTEYEAIKLVLITEEEKSMSFNDLMNNAKNGNPEAQFDLAMRYLNGDGVEPSGRDAAAWLRSAALQGHLDAQYNLGVLYAQGRLVLPPDKLQEWQNGVDLPELEYELLMSGMAFGKAWIKLAADKGHREAQDALSKF